MSSETIASINFQDLMLHRIHEILLVASPYDAFILEEDGRLTQQILYEYLGMNLSYAPRVWHAKNATIGLQMLSDRSYDLVIVMMRIADMDPITFGEKVKESFPDKPIILLAFDESEITHLPEKRLERIIDKIFIWSGNANVFPAIIKNIEDKMNLHRDYKIADIRAIIVVEDNPRYYSIILPLIYRTALKHARDLIDKSLSDIDRLLLFRARPKIILASSYEQATDYYHKYRHNILGFISDVRFPKNGKLNSHAGVELIEYIRKKDSDIPIVLQSTKQVYSKDAKKVKAAFIYKKSPTLLQDLEDFIVNNFGFGDFIFRNLRGKEISRATDLSGFRKSLKKISIKSLEYHASKNHFSNWLAVRGEFYIASNLRPLKVHDFNDLEVLRKLIIEQVDIGIQAHHEGRIVQYSHTAKHEKLDFVRLATGSLGGKARGLAFANNMLSDAKINERYSNIDLRIPKVAVIGTDEFDRFMDENKLWKVAFSKKKSDKAIIKAFTNASLSKELISTLNRYLNDVKYPLAVRSSSLLEDSQYQPLAGMYSTFMLPNSNKSKKTRLEELIKAIKAVYASTYFKEPKALIEGSVHHHEEEKMAVIVMELIGKQHQDRYYPSASGSAQSFNYYPISYMKREEGVAFLALGHKFYALNLNSGFNPQQNGKQENTNVFDLSVAETDGELHWAGSVVSDEDNVIRDSLRHDGTRVITFPSLLKWNTAPISDLLKDVLSMGEDTLGCPVEIEYAINLNKDKNQKHEFCLLQIKPMVIGGIDRMQEFDTIDKKNIICSSSVALGNGLIENIQNIIVVDPKTFNASHTQAITKEIEKINSKIPKGEKYILIGPGRWGSADPWLGIPVNWNQISNAKVIVEVGMKDFPVDPSFGSHFFQNVTSMRIGYFTINHKNKQDRLNMKWLLDQNVKKDGKYTKWINIERSLTVTIDGQTGEGSIIKPLDPIQQSMDEQESTGI